MRHGSAYDVRRFYHFLHIFSYRLAIGIIISLTTESINGANGKTTDVVLFFSYFSLDEAHSAAGATKIKSVECDTISIFPVLTRLGTGLVAKVVVELVTKLANVSGRKTKGHCFPH